MHRSLALLLLTACGAPAAPAPAAPAPAPVALEARDPALAEGVVALAPACVESGDEACNALDDDCDGRIDEGCEGALDGAFVAALAWNGTADVDLVVTPPTGEPERVASQGGCADPEALALERAAIGELEEGTYRVELARAACGDEGPITASVTLAADGRTLGTFNRPLAPGERAPIGSIEVTAPR